MRRSTLPTRICCSCGTARPAPASLPRNRRLREEIAPYLFQEIIASPDPDMALSNLEKFLRAVGARTSFYALLAENREIAKLLIPLFGMSEFLSKIFIQAPELLDAMVSRSFPARKNPARVDSPNWPPFCHRRTILKTVSTSCADTATRSSCASA